ncbi:MAG: hypothetical protein U1A27_11250 [Phycisphaerae bacterium]
MPVLIACAAGMALSGCAVRRTVEVQGNPDQMSDVEFQAYVAEAPLVTVAEAYRAMLILADGQDTCKTFEERKARLESRGIARAAWRLEPDQVLDRGSLAYMVMRICTIKGGVNSITLGALGLGDRRYALRELVYRDMLADGVDYEVIRGGELVAVMGKADRYMQQEHVYDTTPMQLPPEPKPGETPSWATTSQPAGS